MASSGFTTCPRYLAGLSDIELDLLFSKGETGEAAKGTTIIEQGSKQDRLYFVLSGRALVRLERSSSATDVAELRPGESFGEMTVFAPGPASASVVASEPMQYWSITRGGLEDFLYGKPDIAGRFYKSIIGELSQRLRVVNENLPADTARVSEGWW